MYLFDIKQKILKNNFLSKKIQAVKIFNSTYEKLR